MFKNALLETTNAKITFDEPMRKHTGYGVGGCARYYAQIDSLYSLNNLINLAKQHKVKYKVVGNGTNILVSDLGYDGLIIDTKRLCDVFFKREHIKAMAGAKLDKLLQFAIDNKLSGLEAFAGIPATVGGAIVMNAGAFGHNISEIIVTVETLCDGKIKVYDKRDCKFGYRTSRFLKGKEVVVSATFEVKSGDREKIYDSIKSYKDLRRLVQPAGKSCGSVFKNPKPFSAGALIEKAGLKGYSIGGAIVSEKHANFIITSSKARARDVYQLITIIKQKVKDAFGVDLVEEVECVGEF